MNNGLYAEEDDEIPSDEVILLNVTPTQANTLFDRIHNTFLFVQSGLWLPKSLRDSPYTFPVFGLVSAGILVLPIRIYAVLVLVGFLIGFVYASPALNQNDLDEGSKIKWKVKMDKIVAEEDDDEYARPKSPISCTGFTFQNPVLDTSLDKFLGRLVKDLIDPWFMQLNKSGNMEFQSCVRSSINAAVMNLVRIIEGHSKDVLTLFIYGITNAIGIHMVLPYFMLFPAISIYLSE